MHSSYDNLHRTPYNRRLLYAHLDLNPEPEGHYALFVDLTPHIEDGEDERGAEHHQTEEERDDDKADGVED